MSAARVLSPQPFEVEGARGLRYVDLPPGSERRLAAWLREGRVVGGEEIKPGAVYAHGDWIVKFFEGASTWRDRLRPSPARRSARRHAALQDIGAPLPIATLEERRGRSLLVMERIEGRFLWELLDAGDAPALEAFPEFMATMHHRRVFHGDLHMKQMLWGAGRWHLLDLDGMRHRLRNLRVRPLIETQWGRLQYDLQGKEGLRELFLRYLPVAGLAWDPDRAWKRVLDRARWFEERP